MSLYRTASLLTLSLLITGGAFAAPKGVTPAGMDGFLVFMANGVYDPTEPPPVPVSGSYFDEVIMGRDAAAVEDRRQVALDYFAERFGMHFILLPPSPIQGGDLVGIAIDPSSPTGVNEGVILLYGYQDQRWGYTAHVIGDEKVGPEGRVVHDANYAMAVIGPPGVTLTGTWGGSGIFVPPGTVAVNGEYLIEHPKKASKDIHITWESTDPIFDAFSLAGIDFDCAMHSERFGEGVALGRNFTRPVPGTALVQTVIRNVITFPNPAYLGGPLPGDSDSD